MLQVAYFDAGSYRDFKGESECAYTCLVYSDLVTYRPGFVWLWRGDILLPLEAAERGLWRVLPPNVVDDCEETGDAFFVNSTPGHVSVPDLVDAADPRLVPFYLEPKAYPRLMPAEVAAVLGISVKAVSPG